MNNFVEIIGLFAGGCTTVSFLPQVLRVWKSRSARDISLGMYVIFCVGVLLWIIYGVLLHSPAVVIANTLTFLLALSILIMKIVWS